MARPTFRGALNTDGSYLIEITPDKTLSKKKKMITLTGEEYTNRFVPWLKGQKTMRQAFPDKPSDFHELFISGMSKSEFEKLIPKE